MFSIVIPPNDGLAMRTMMSAPRPADVSTGSRARIVVALAVRLIEGLERAFVRKGSRLDTAFFTADGNS